jgi:cell fate regulator YaaT (PSP1 superfamily)
MHVYDWLADLGVAGPSVNYPIVEVTFKGGRKSFYRNTRELDVQTGDFILVEADRGIDFGTVHMTGELVRMRVKTSNGADESDFPNVIRHASIDDIERWETNRDREAETFHVGRQAIDRLGLPMKLVDVEWQFDHNKVTFYFTADHRVDFRALVRDLASTFRTRVELRQIGARDEAARVGGIGSCGRELCCSTWLQEFKPVSTQAARMQNLPLNPVRLSGQCGRLKCCLNYELEQYMHALRHFPRIDTPVESEMGRGSVQKLDIFKERVWVQYEDGSWVDLSIEEARAVIVEDDSDDRPSRSRRGNRPPGGGQA